MSKEMENLNSRKNQKEKDIEKINGMMMKLSEDILATKDEIVLMKLQKQAEMLQKQADGLREDRKSLETQLSNLENRKREREEPSEPSKRPKEEFDNILKKYSITKQDLEKEQKVLLLEKFCPTKDLKEFTIQV